MESNVATEFLEGYSSSKATAKELCWAMAIAPSCRNVKVHEIRDYGWIVDCDCDNQKMARNQVHSIMKKRYFSVDWM